MDYGNSEAVSLDDLCELPTELCRLPMMVFVCVCVCVCVCVGGGLECDGMCVWGGFE